MIYLCGTDLETQGSMATTNLMEIAQTTPNDQVNVVIQTGGTRQWHAQELGLDISTDMLQRYSYDADGFTLVEELPLANMASAGTLTDFVSWGAAAYPAEKYLLVMWDHGGGSLNGLIQDELHNNSLMTLEQVEVSLENAGVQLEAVMLDTCLMASLEMAQTLQSSAKYMIASEETVPGQGSAYDRWLQFLYDVPTCNGERLGREICNSIQQKYAELGMASTSRTLTFSVVDLSKIDAVTEAFNRMFKEVGALLEDPDDFYAFAYAVKNTQHYALSSMVDLADMARRAKDIAITSETANAVIESVNEAVTFCIKGDQRSYSNGLSFYYNPTTYFPLLDRYARGNKNPEYLAFMDAVSMSWTAPEWVYEQTERLPDVSYHAYNVETEVGLTEEGQPMLTITNAPAAVSAVTVTLLQYNQKTDTWTTFGEMENVEGSFEDGLFYAAFPEEWMTLNGNFCEIGVVEETEEYVLYRVPFLLEYDDGSLGQYEFRLGYEYAQPLTAEVVSEDAAASEDEAAAAEEAVPEEEPEDTLMFYGVWDQDGADSISLPSRNVTDLSAYMGTTIMLTQTSLSADGFEVIGTVDSKPFTISPDMSLDVKQLPKGEYCMIFNVTNVFGETSQTDALTLTWNGREAVFDAPVAEEDAA